MYYSQFGEDRILEEIFASKREGLCVEVGANNGVHGSTTLHFEERGWRCILIEPNPDLCRELRARRKGPIFECAASRERGVATLQIASGADLAHGVSALGGDETADRIRRRHHFEAQPVSVQTRRLDDILEEACPGKTIDFVTIDVEGHELAVLQGFSAERWRPTVLIIEDNNWEPTVASYLRRRGYVRFRRTGVNDWYAHETNRDLVSLQSRSAYLVLTALVRGSEKARALLSPALRHVPGVTWLYRLLTRHTGSPS